MANPTMTLISSQTLGGTTASVTFSSIPTSYNDLKLVVSARGDAVTSNLTVNLKLNGDTATNYSWTYLLAQNTTPQSGRQSTQTVDTNGGIDAASQTASTFGAWELYFPNYNSTGSKPFLGTFVAENNATTSSTWMLDATASLYRGASGITSIVLTPNSGNFVQYSNFYLYGIKNS